MSDTDTAGGDSAPVASSAPATTQDSPASAPAATGGGGGGEGGGESTGGGLAAVGAALTEFATYTVIRSQLVIASLRLARLSDQVTGTYRYMQGCSRSVQRLADRAAALNVDRDTLAEHRDAAKMMLSVLAEAEAMAAISTDLSAYFQAAADAHEADYGPVDDKISTKEGALADREFYANR